MAKVVYSPEIAAMRGKLGNTVHTKARNGATVRARVMPKNRITPAQTAARQRLVRVARAYKGFSAIQLAAWKAYAAKLVKHDPFTGKAYSPAPNTVYVGLAAKAMQVDPSQPAPTVPPPYPFAPPPNAYALFVSKGSITVVASDPDPDDVTTEIFLQHLPGPARKPSRRAYRHRAFYAYPDYGIPYAVQAASGWNAVAVQRVDPVTGQIADFTEIGIVQVP